MFGPAVPVITPFISAESAPRVITCRVLRCVMVKRMLSTFFFIISLSMLIVPALATQQCSVSVASNQHGYWSWRLIDGRKCWYEGKPMLSKSLLAWPAQAVEHPNSVEYFAPIRTLKSNDPSNAQAREIDEQVKAIDDSESFEALWHARVGRHM